MGIYFNPSNENFQMSLNSKIYVDKSGLIEYTNSILNTRQRYVCVSRPRRFGKSMAGEMLIAYYGKGNDSHSQFDHLEISKYEDYEIHLNKYNTIFLNIQDFLSEAESPEKITEYLQNEVISDICDSCSDIKPETNILTSVLKKVYNKTREKFVIIIDEWDCIFREKQNKEELQKKYLDFLRNLLKDKPYIALVYITGILPVKKYGSHSALNMFDEYSMIKMGDLDRFTGFTEDEVKALCNEHSTDFDNIQKWYDGYLVNDYHIYNPKSVVDSIRFKDIGNYWTRTETYEALKIYIDMNFDGLKDSVVKMLAGENCKIDTGSFQNDMVNFKSKDDVLTLLVHLGYLAFDKDKSEIFIPNEEIRDEFLRSMKNGNYKEIVKAVQKSEELLKATLNFDEEYVAQAIDEVHSENTSVLNYNNENSLSCVISLAYYSARNEYIIKREPVGGKGFADIAFIPRKNVDKPAMIIELKWDKSAKAALEQIKRKEYIKALDDYCGSVILVGINYDKQEKRHNCIIEKIEK